LATTKRELAKFLFNANPWGGWEGADQQAPDEARWENIVQEEKSRSGQVACDLTEGMELALSKVVIAHRLRRETTVGNIWIAERLWVCDRNHVSLLVNRKGY